MPFECVPAFARKVTVMFCHRWQSWIGVYRVPACMLTLASPLLSNFHIDDEVSMCDKSYMLQFPAVDKGGAVVHISLRDACLSALGVFFPFGESNTRGHV